MKKTGFISLMGLLMLFAFSFTFTSCTEDEPEPIEALITEFAVTNAGAQGNQRAEGVIDGTTILLVVPYETNLTALTTDIKLSPGASVVPASGASVDFSETRSFVVTNGTESNIYQVTAERADPTSAVITEIQFVSHSAGETYTNEINQTAKTITVTLNDLQNPKAVIKNLKVLPVGATKQYSWGTHDTLDLKATGNKITLSLAGAQTVYDIIANITVAGFDPAKATVLMNKSRGANLLPSIIDNENSRGAAFNGRYLFVASRKDGNYIYYWDMENPNAEPKTLALPESVVSGGNWRVSDVRVVGDNIYVSNMVMAEGGIFKVYKWEGVNDDTPEIVLQYTVPAANVRLGDAISIIGNPPADGHIFASNFPNPITTISEFYVWSFNGAAGSNRVVQITPKVALRMGQYGRVSAVPESAELLLVTGAEMGIAVMDFNGDIKYETVEPVTQNRSYDPRIFEYNGARYLTFAVNRAWEPAIGHWYEVINITEGANILDALKALNSGNITSKRVFKHFYGGAVNPQFEGATTGVGFDSAGKPRIMGFSVQQGFVVHQLSN
jgi:hypothetical protein